MSFNPEPSLSDLFERAGEIPGGNINNPFSRSFEPQNFEDREILGPREPYGPPPGWDANTATEDWEGRALKDFNEAVGFDHYGRAYYGTGMVGWFKSTKGQVFDIAAEPFSAKMLGDTVGLMVDRTLGIFNEILDPAIEQTLGGYANTMERLAEGSPIGEIEKPDFLIQRDDDVRFWRLAKDAIDIITSTTIESAWNTVRAVANPETMAQFFNIYYAPTGATNLGLADQEKLTPEERVLKRDIEIGIQAARAFYSTAIDPATKTNAINKIANGDDPGLVALEMAIPGAELFGQILFDPLNLLGKLLRTNRVIKLTEQARKTATLDDASDLGRAYDALNVATKNGDEVAATSAFQDMITTVNKRVAGQSAKNLKDAANLSFFGKTAGTLRNLKSRKVAEYLRWLAHETADSPEDMLLMLDGLVKMTGTKADEIAQGLQIAMNPKFGLGGRLTLSDDALEVGLTMRRMIEDGDGILNFNQFLTDLATVKRGKAATTAAGIENAANAAVQGLAPQSKIKQLLEHIEDTGNLKKLFPDAKDIAEAGGEVNRGALAIDTGHRFVQRVIYQPLHAIFTPLYMGLSLFAFPIRNWINGVVTATTDLGKSAVAYSFWRSAKYAERLAASWIGEIAPKGITAAGLSAPTKGVINLGTRAAQALEKGADVRIRAIAIEQVMKRALMEGRAMPAMDNLRAAGLSDDMALSLRRSLFQHKGDGKKAIEELVSKFGEDGMDSVRAGTWADSADLAKLDKLRTGLSDLIMKDVGEAAKKGKEAAIKALRQYYDDIVSESKKTKGEFPIPMVNDENQAVLDDSDWVHGKEAVITLQAAADAGYTTENLSGLIASRIKWNNDTIRGYQRILSDMPFALSRSGFPMETKLGAQAGDLVRAAQESAWNAADVAFKQSDDLQKVAMEISQRSLNTSRDGLADLWNELDMGSLLGEYPENLTGKEFRGLIWDDFYPRKQNEFYIKQREETASAVHIAFDEIEKAGVTGIDLNNDLLDQARSAHREALKWDQGVVNPETGLVFGVNHKRDVLNELGKRVGIETQTETGAQTDHLFNAIKKHAGFGAGDVPKQLKTLDISEIPTSEMDPNTAAWVSMQADNIKRQIEAAEEGFLEFAKSNSDPDGMIIASGKSSFPDWYSEELGSAYYVTKDGEKLSGRLAVESALGDIVFGEDTNKYVLTRRLRDRISREIQGGKNMPDDVLEFLMSKEPPKKLEDVPFPVAVDALRRRHLEEAGQAGANAERIAELNEEANRLRKAFDASGGDSDTAFQLTEVRLELEELQKAAQEGADPFPNVRDLADQLGEALTPPPAEYPTEARRLYDSLQGPDHLDNLTKTFDRLEAAIEEGFGRTVEGEMSPALIAELATYGDEMAPRISEARLLARKVSEEMRDFILLNYGDKTRVDAALGYAYMYPYFYSRTYLNWAKRITKSPDVISHYANYREAMERLHAGAPEWWKYQINSNELLGIDSDHPFFFNLESTINPLMGLIGVDFEVAEYKDNWMASIVQDLNRFGPATWTPYAWAAAISLYKQGEEEAAQKMGGELLPFSNPIRAATALAGVNDGKGIELDPFVGLLYGGLDAWERSRAGRAISAQILENPEREAEILEQARLQEGEFWDEAIARSQKERAIGTLASYMLGTSFKGRSLNDLEIDRFYNDYYRLWGQYPNLSGDEFRANMARLNQEYPFMDALLLSRKGGPERDIAYIYNVFQRIPPGMSGEMQRALNIDGDLVARFWDEKGQITEWSETDQKRIMAFALDLGAALEVPDEATKQEWDAASKAFGDMVDAGLKMFGSIVARKEDTLFGFDWQSQAGRDGYKQYLQDNPDLDGYRMWKDEQISTSSLLSAYYGGIELFRSHTRNQMYGAIEAKTGPMAELWAEYDRLDRFGLSKEKGEFWDANPEFQIYMDLRDAWLPRVDESVLDFGLKLREGIQPELRDVEEKSSGTEAIVDLFDQIDSDQQAQDVALAAQDKIRDIGGATLLNQTLKFAETGEMSKAVREALQDLAEQLGMPFSELLALIEAAALAQPQ